MTDEEKPQEISLLDVVEKTNVTCQNIQVQDDEALPAGPGHPRLSQQCRRLGDRQRQTPRLKESELQPIGEIAACYKT